MKPAARVSDLHVCPMVTGLVPHVGGPLLPPGHAKTLIAGLPAARLADKAICVGPPDMIVTGAGTTMIAGLPAARMGDSTAHGGVIALGCMTVLIGDGAATASMQQMTMSAAKRAGKPFCEECARIEARRRTQASTQSAALSAAKSVAAPFCEECR